MAVIRDAAGSLLARASRSSAGEGGLGVAFSRILLPAMRGGAPPQVGPPTPDLLEPGDRLDFERLLLWVRLLFVGIAVLPLLAFGSRPAPYAVLIAAAALGSCGLVWLLARCWPQTLLRFQIGLRLIDCALVSLVLVNYHAFLGDAYYDSAYVLFVVGAAATHGRRGALLVALVGAAAVLAGRALLVAGGDVAFEVRHLTDSVYYLLFFLSTGLAVAFLMRRSSEVVERRERVWRAVLQQMPAGVAIAEAPSGRLILGNEQLEQLLGHPCFEAADIQEYVRHHVFHPDGAAYQPRELPLARAIRAGEVVQAEEMEIERADGERITASVSAAPIRDRLGQIVAGVLTADDVTWRKRAEEAQRFLSQASEQLGASLDYETTLANLTRLAVPTLADMCIVDELDADGTIRRVAVTHADPAKQELARALREQYPPATGSAFAVPRVLRTGRSELTPRVDPTRLEGFARDPEHLQVLWGLAPRSSMNVPLIARGRTLGALTFVITESARRYGPADLELAEELARRAALAVDNARLYQEAQDAVQMRDEFLSAASHDLKSPLVSVKGYAQILGALVGQQGEPPREQVLAGLGKIDAAATKMSALIDELLDVAHLQAGRPLTLDRRPTDLTALVQQATAEHQAHPAKHLLLVESSESSLLGVWDPGRLERVLANLLSNAIKYSPQGGTIRLRVGREEDAAGRWATLQVRDEGLGIPAADLPRVFERFHRGQNVAGYIQGSGIGLAGARQIVLQHGGTISVESQEGAGATFTVRLPLQPRESTPPPAENPSGESPDESGAPQHAVAGGAADGRAVGASSKSRRR